MKEIKDSIHSLEQDVETLATENVDLEHRIVSVIMFFVFIMLLFVCCSTEVQETETFCSEAAYINTIANPPPGDLNNELPKGIGFFMQCGSEWEFIKHVDSDLTHGDFYVIRFTEDFEIVSYEERIMNDKGRPVNACETDYTTNKLCPLN